VHEVALVFLVALVLVEDQEEVDELSVDV